jgi:tetratricopeptide (TPR) repeat protein
MQPAPNPAPPANPEPRQDTPQVTPPPPPVKDTPPVAREKTPPQPAKQTLPPPQPEPRARPEAPKAPEPPRTTEPREDPGLVAKRALEDGTRLEKSGDLRAALDRYERAAQIDPSMATIANGLADTVKGMMKTAAQDALTRAKQYDALDRVPDAIKWYERAYANLLDSDPARKVVKDRLDLLRTRK